MCTVLLPPGGYPIAVNTIYHIISYYGNIISKGKEVRLDECLGFERGVSRSRRLGSSWRGEVVVAEGPVDVDRTQYSEYTLTFVL
jgi:hypothetical protein